MGDAKDKLIVFLKGSIAKNGADIEATHVTAEELLQDYLRESGEAELAELWREASEDWWYA